MSGQLFHCNRLGDVLVDVSQNIVHLMIIAVAAVPVFSGIRSRSFSGGVLFRTADEQGVEHDHQLHESGVFRDVMGKAFRGSDFVDIIEETFLLFLVERKLMGKGGTAVSEAKAQIRLFGGDLLHEIRRHGQDDPLMDGVVDLGQLVTFVLVDDKEIARGDGVEAVVDKELFAAADGIVDLVAVVDVHIHGFFFFIQVGNGKGPGVFTVFYGCFTGGKFFHFFHPFRFFFH